MSKLVQNALKHLVVGTTLEYPVARNAGYRVPQQQQAQHSNNQGHGNQGNGNHGH